MPRFIRNGKTFSGTPTRVDTAKSYTTFTSNDNKSPTQWTEVELLTSKEEHQSMFNKISTMFKNIRYLYKVLGNTDISAIGDGTITGGLNTLNGSLKKKVPDVFCNTNGTIERLQARNLSNKVSFDWQAENGVMYVYVYIDDTLIAKIPEGTMALNSSLTVKSYNIATDATVLNSGSGVRLRKQGNFYYVDTQIQPLFDSMDAWSRIKIGTISDWTGEKINWACNLNALGYPTTMPTLELLIESDGNIYIYVHGAVSGIKNIWFAGRSTVYTEVTT